MLTLRYVTPPPTPTGFLDPVLPEPEERRNQ